MPILLRNQTLSGAGIDAGSDRDERDDRTRSAPDHQQGECDREYGRESAGLGEPRQVGRHLDDQRQDDRDGLPCSRGEAQ